MRYATKFSGSVSRNQPVVGGGIFLDWPPDKMNVVRNSVGFDADRLFTSGSRQSLGGATAQSMAVDFEGMLTRVRTIIPRGFLVLPSPTFG